MAEEVAFKLFGTRIVMDPSRNSKAEVHNDVAREKHFPTSPSPSPPATTTITKHHIPSDKAAAVAAAAAAAAAAVGLPCPRCKSKETKFCYFNNYNVNQPRHFCRGCQRYWTAGGALRNVPVGAGRRKARPPPVDEDRLGGVRVSGGAGVGVGGGGVFGFSAGLEGVVVQQWLGFPAKRPNTSMPDQIR